MAMTYAGREVPQLDPPLHSEHRYTCPDWELEWLYREVPRMVARRDVQHQHYYSEDKAGGGSGGPRTRAWWQAPRTRRDAGVPKPEGR